MRIDPAIQLQLLDLSAVDLKLQQLTHRRANLPEISRIQQAQEELSTTQSRLMDLQTAHNDLGREMGRLESDTEAVRSRQQRNSERMTSGSIKASKDLEAIEHEIATLKRRQGELEDQELELMERAEQIDADLATVTEQRAGIEQQRDDALAARDAEWVQIDQQVADVKADRTGLVGRLPAELVGLYERIAATGTTGAAAMTQRRCGGCRLEFDGSTLAALRKADPEEVVRCDSCGTIQIRTEESGL
ncbi:zinc ribbon domain-containing protein [Antricoccus suffuscus]|uniref:zinc ribbon domain-containing protein n=1 Tax=Antricoccus suffuscus TaxID=1629062 RepID=UPI0014752632|nr:C4-type zinc ribbon domain-containing protein [Antricoccus suffuscus]